MSLIFAQAVDECAVLAAINAHCDATGTAPRAVHLASRTGLDPVVLAAALARLIDEGRVSRGIFDATCYHATGRARRPI